MWYISDQRGFEEAIEEASEEASSASGTAASAAIHWCRQLIFHTMVLSAVVMHVEQIRGLLQLTGCKCRVLLQVRLTRHAH
jgi:phosphoribosyl-ATP pyrophosphohydrolase